MIYPLHLVVFSWTVWSETICFQAKVELVCWLCWAGMITAICHQWFSWLFDSWWFQQTCWNRFVVFSWNPKHPQWAPHAPATSGQWSLLWAQTWTDVWFVPLQSNCNPTVMAGNKSYFFMIFIFFFYLKKYMTDVTPAPVQRGWSKAMWWRRRIAFVSLCFCGFIGGGHIVWSYSVL